MGDRSDFNDFLETNNRLLNMAKKKYDCFDELSRYNHELVKRNQEVEAENKKLRQRISNDSEMNHRSNQSSSEDATSRNKRSEVLYKYETMDGATRRHAIEAFGKPSDRSELWYRKDLTCRIFWTAYKLAEDTKQKFNEEALPRFFQSAPSVAAYFKESTSQTSKLSEKRISEEMRTLLSTKSFKVACSSVLKEMAASCDLTDLEEKLMKKLPGRCDQWRASCPWLPVLDGNAMQNAKIKTYIKDCLRVAWRMVNLLPPLKIVTIDDVPQGKPIDHFFKIEIEESKEKAKTMEVCVWPAVVQHDDVDKAVEKGMVVIIPRPKNQPFSV